jgi:DNA topoisomerase-1
MGHIHVHIHRTRDAGYKSSEARRPTGEWTEEGGGAPSAKPVARAKSTIAKPVAKPATAKPLTMPRGKATTQKAQTPTKVKPVAANTPKPRATSGLIPAPADKSQWPEHLKKLRVPPAWTDVQIHPDPKSELQVTGLDVKGRRQSLYSEEHSKQSSAKKFARVANLAKNLDQITTKNNKNLNSRDKGTQEHAQCLGLMISTGIRPGSERDTGAEKQAYGATTLQGQHVVTENGQTRLVFVGKKGVDLDIPIEDPEIAKMLQHRAVEAGPNGKLFANITDSSLRRYTSQITGGKAKPKDFRTLVGTSTAMRLMQTMNKPKDMKEYKKSVMAVAKQVSQKLGNTPAIALASYIAPQVFDGWKIA